MTTCKAWVPSGGGNRYCGAPAARRMLTRHDGEVAVCQQHYEEERGRG